MSNCLKMTKVSAILTLKERNWSCRRISRELGIHLDTVRKYAGSAGHDSKQVNAPIGSEGSKPVTEAPTGLEPDISDYQIADDNKTKGTPSQCHPFGNACEIALSHNAFRLKTIRDIIKRGGNKQQQMEFIDEHPIIRDMSSYGEFVKDILR